MKHRSRLWWKRVGHCLASILKVLRQLAGIIRAVTYLWELVQDLLDLMEDPVSLETPVGDGESIYGDLIEDENTELPEVTTAERMRSAELAEALKHLKPRMRHVLARRFGLSGTPPQTRMRTVGWRQQFSI